MAKNELNWVIEPWILKFGVRPLDPGFIYIIENDGRYKVGRSISRIKRIQAAKTWLPDMQVIGVKPFWDVQKIEKDLHVGFATCWYEGEWFDPMDDASRDVLIDGFREFSDKDINQNSVNFIYWFNGDGMAEFCHEQYAQRATIKKFQRQETETRKGPDTEKF